MARIVGVNLPDDKRVEYALTLIYGIGWSTSSAILSKTRVDTHKKVKDLTEEERKELQRVIERYKVEGVLREEIRGNIKRLKETGSYRGTRHSKGLPVRGQRTRSNARTKRGKKKTVGALRKAAYAKLEQGPK